MNLRERASRLKARVDLRDIVSYFWGTPARRQQTYDQYFSAWRDDGGHPSFTVYAANYYDFGGANDFGDVYSFVQRELNLPYWQSVHWLEAHLEGTPLPHPPPRRYHPPPTATTSPPSAAWIKSASAAAAAAANYLWSGRTDANRALDYLRTVRGLRDETIRAAGYGYNPVWRQIDFPNPETGQPIHLAPGITEPWYSDGHLWSLRIRCRVGNLARHLGLKDDEYQDGLPMPKYINLIGSKQAGALYNADSLRPGQDVLVVEGAFDAVLARQTLADVGLSLPVVTFGSATSRPSPLRIDQLRAARRVFLLLDADEAGRKARQQLTALLGDRAYPITLPKGKDVTDFILQHNGSLSGLLNITNRQLWWPQGVPDSIRSILLTYFRDSTAPVIEMVNRAACENLINTDSFTAAQLIAASRTLNFDLTDATIRRVLNDLTDYFFAKLEAGIYREETVLKSGKNAGRRPDYYALCPLESVQAALLAWVRPRLVEEVHPTADSDDPLLAKLTPEMMTALGCDAQQAEAFSTELADVFRPVFAQQEHRERRAAWLVERRYQSIVTSLKDDSSTPLPSAWPLKNAATYRAAFLRATNDPRRRRSRRSLRQLLGVSEGSLGHLISLAGLEPVNREGEFEYLPLPPCPDISRTVQDMAGHVGGYPRGVSVESPVRGKLECVYEGAATEDFIRDHWATGSTVYVRFQVANRYVSVADEPLLTAAPPAPPQPRVAASPPPAPPLQDSPAPGAYYGPTYNPGWVYAQLVLALRLLASERWRWGSVAGQATLLDLTTGELIPDPSAELLLGCLLNRPPPLPRASPPA
ncbi:MAG: toprim domain-containing protein [Anaerolineae bacterium]|nr:toprim domain-containing protein [Anaerolineae bacterium]